MSNSHYYLAFRASVDALILSDASTGRIEDANPAAQQLYGYSLSEFKEMTVDALCDPCRSQGSEEPEVSVPLMQRHYRKGGQSFPVDVNIAQFTVDGRKITVMSTRDVTERDEAEKLRFHFIESVVAAQEEERRHIARELHDATGQWLTALIVGLRQLERGRSLEEVAQRAATLGQQAEQALAEVRQLSRGLHPLVLDTLGLGSAVRNFSEELAELHGLEISVNSVGLEDHALPLELQTAVYRIVQEALTNVAKHANAKNVGVVVQHQSSTILVIVEDDGEGASSGPTQSKAGLGLTSIRERATLLGGDAAFESQPGEGTTLFVRIPAPEENV